MRFAVYVTFGAVAGVLAVRRATQAAQRYSPAGVQARAFGLRRRALEFWSEVREAAAEREVELREALELDGRHDVVDAGA